MSDVDDGVSIGVSLLSFGVAVDLCRSRTFVNQL